MNDLPSCRHFATALSILAAGLVAWSVPAQRAGAATIYELTADADAYIDGNAKAANFGTAGELQVRYRDDADIFNQNVLGTQKSYLRYDVSVPRLDELFRAQVTLTVSTVDLFGNSEQLDWEFALFGVNNDDGGLEAFIEGNGGTDNNPAGELTWNNAPGNVATPVDGTHTPPFMDTGAGAGQAVLLGTAILPASSGDPLARGDQLVFDTDDPDVNGLLDFILNSGSDQSITLILAKLEVPDELNAAQQRIHSFFSTENTDLDAVAPSLTLFVPEPTSAVVLALAATLVVRRRPRSHRHA